MPLSGADITIAITVYNRREYVQQAIASALAQTATPSPTVIVVEDCGPDPTLRDDVVDHFGDRITYLRNGTRRGLFDNWNACLEACRTPWLCILHDDDWLEPSFVSSMIELNSAAPERGLYFGACRTVDRAGTVMIDAPAAEPFRWHEMDLHACARYDPVCFPGQLFNVVAARQIGGFRRYSHYCADWEMWFRIALRFGAAGTNRIVANYREHLTAGRGTTQADVSGRKYAYVNMQRKRHFRWLREAGSKVEFQRDALQAEAPMPSRFILQHAHSFSPLMLRYNAGLFFCSKAPHTGYRMLQWLARVLTWRSLRPASRLFNSAIR
jgi:glycosyltransferase involved in cell wall biosynthesis